MDILADFFVGFFSHAKNWLSAFWDSNNRMFSLYLLSSGLIAYLIFKSSAAKQSADEKTFLRFLFPKKVWSHPSAWLDLRYFFFHGFVGHFLLVGVSAVSVAFTFKLFSGENIGSVAGEHTLSAAAEFAVSIVFMFFAMFIADFLGWFCHWLQHKSPLLWQFHKVHHSAEVMHPVSNFREHPIDNALYIVVIGGGYGVVLAIAYAVVGYLPSMPMILGVTVLMFVFNIVGYNLRHSHVWLRWPGKFSMIFPSPAHHHVHHSSHPDHVDKNFAFMFPIWDVIFNTYEMPKDNRDVKFGIGDGNAEELTSCLRLYWVPFRDAFRVMKAQTKGVEFNMSKPEPVEDTRAAEKTYPAE